MRLHFVPVLLLACLVSTGHSFVPASSTTTRHASSSALQLAQKNTNVPTFDPKTQRWSPAPKGESAADAYDALGTFLRQGPKAYLSRVANADTYDQACLKFMAREKCSYQMAQGNMDRMAENAQDWAFERMEADKAGRTIDYVTLDQKQVALTLIWAALSSALLGRGLYVIITGDHFNDIFR